MPVAVPVMLRVLPSSDSTNCMFAETVLPGIGARMAFLTMGIAVPPWAVGRRRRNSALNRRPSFGRQLEDAGRPPDTTHLPSR